MAAGTASLCFTLLFVVLVSAEQKIITAEIGQDVTLTCRAPKNNKIMIVEWSRVDLDKKYVLVYRDSQFIPYNQHPSFKNRVDLKDRQMKDGDVSLTLKKVTTADEGTYECHVLMEETNSWEHSSIALRVVPPGQRGGLREDEEEEKDGAVGLIVTALLLVAAVVGFVI